MKVIIHPSWSKVLTNEFKKNYFKKLDDFVTTQYAKHTCFPPEKNIFDAFNLVPFQKVKIVLLGQDPYHGKGQAHGLCFSVPEGMAKPPSLQNIFKEIEQDLGNPIPQNGNLEHWAAQGVLLLNATLSVRANEAGSHQNKGWEIFTDQIIKLLSAEKEGLVFLLWGGYAKKKVKLIDTTKHLVLASGHPSPLSANRGYWFGNKHFSKTNNFLEAQGKEKIMW